MKPDSVEGYDKQIADLRKAKGRLAFYKILNWSNRKDYTHLKNVQSACIAQILLVILLLSKLTRREDPSASPMFLASPLLVLWLIASLIILVRTRKLLRVFEEHSPQSIDEIIEKIRSQNPAQNALDVENAP